MRLIITADDFGRSQEINQAIARAHREGILTCASLMVAGDAVEEAVAIAKENPKLGVGLHLVLIDGRAVLPREKIPDLVDDRGFFPNSPARLGIRYTLSRRIRAQLEMEIEAQFDRFASFGIVLSHVDGHQHMHMLPAVFPIVAGVARKYGAEGIRIVRGEGLGCRAGFNPPMGEGGLKPALNSDFRTPNPEPSLLQRVIWAAGFKWMSRKALRRVRDRRNVIIADRVYGLMQTGRMNVAYVEAVLRRLMQRQTNELIEIYFHPTLGSRLDDFGPNPDDFQALIDPQIKQLIRASGHELTTYSEAGNIFPLLAEGGSPGRPA